MLDLYQTLPQPCRKCCKIRRAFRPCGSRYRFFSSLKSFFMNTGEEVGRILQFLLPLQARLKPTSYQWARFCRSKP